MMQIPLPFVAAPQPTFDSFVPGRNHAALAHLQLLGVPSAPAVYLWGDSGSGKTHLLGALAEAFGQGGLGVARFDAHDPLPWPMPDDTALLVLDRCHLLDAAAQQAAFTLLVEAAGSGVQVAAAGTLPPVDLPLRDDLRTRLAQGHVFALQALAEDDTRVALQTEARRRLIDVPGDVVGWLLTHHRRDLPSLLDVVACLDRYAMARSRHMTVPLLREMLAAAVHSDNAHEAALAQRPAHAGP